MINLNLEIFSNENFLIKNNIKNVSLISEASQSPSLCLTSSDNDLIIINGVDEINNFIYDLINKNKIQNDSNEPIIFFNKSKTD